MQTTAATASPSNSDQKYKVGSVSQSVRQTSESSPSSTALTPKIRVCYRYEDTVPSFTGKEDKRKLATTTKTTAVLILQTRESLTSSSVNHELISASVQRHYADVDNRKFARIRALSQLIKNIKSFLKNNNDTSSPEYKYINEQVISNLKVDLANLYQKYNSKLINHQKQ